MPKIREILSLAAASGASDVHITTGLAPMMRIHGSLTAQPFEKLTESSRNRASHRPESHRGPPAKPPAERRHSCGYPGRFRAD